MKPLEKKERERWRDCRSSYQTKIDSEIRYHTNWEIFLPRVFPSPWYEMHWCNPCYFLWLGPAPLWYHHKEGRPGSGFSQHFQAAELWSTRHPSAFSSECARTQWTPSPAPTAAPAFYTARQNTGKPYKATFRGESVLAENSWRVGCRLFSSPTYFFNAFPAINVSANIPECM